MTQATGEDVGMMVLEWSGDLSIRRIAELKREVQGALQAARSVSLRIAADAVGDLTLLQLLCSAHRTAVGQGRTLQLAEPLPRQCEEMMSLSGFSRHIGCAQDTSASCLWQRIHQQRNGAGRSGAALLTPTAADEREE